MIQRTAPGNDRPADLMAADRELREYRFEARNFGPREADDVVLQAVCAVGLQASLWDCYAKAGECEPVGRSGLTTTRFDLAAEATTGVGLSASLVPDTEIVELEVRLLAPPGTTLLNPLGDRAVFIDAVGPNALFKSRFE
ncbi:MAG TPA: hypothetical protein PKZ76_01165 [Xanthomonadaceae bacterium]|nr:hypothetical protein [Xanthomonadaceae bacterium]